MSSACVPTEPVEPSTTTSRRSGGVVTTPVSQRGGQGQVKGAWRREVGSGPDGTAPPSPVRVRSTAALDKGARRLRDTNGAGDAGGEPPAAQASQQNRMCRGIVRPLLPSRL